MLILNFYADSLTYKKSKQKAAFTLTALLANIGGLLGLCLGASVITLIEIVELLLSCCAKLASRLCCGKKGKVEEKRASVTVEDM